MPNDDPIAITLQVTEILEQMVQELRVTDILLRALDEIA